MIKEEVIATLGSMAETEKQLKTDAENLLNKLIVELTDEQRKKPVEIWLNDDIKVKAFNADGTIWVELSNNDIKAIDFITAIDNNGDNEIQNAETFIDIDCLNYTEIIDLISYIVFTYDD